VQSVLEVLLTIIVKALVSAHLHEADHGLVKKAICGIVFLATPHRGSTPGVLVSMLKNLLKVAHKVNPRMVSSGFLISSLQIPR
jgi:hypothetical protein